MDIKDKSKQNNASSITVQSSINNTLMSKQNTTSTAKTVVAQIYTGFPLPIEFQTDEEKKAGKIIYTGHRDDVVDLVTITGNILYGTKLNSPDYISIIYPSGHMFEVDLNGTEVTQLQQVHGGSNNTFTAKPYPVVHRNEIPIKSTSPEQVAALDSVRKLPAQHPNAPEQKSWLEERWGDAKAIYGSGQFSCPHSTDDVPFKDILKSLKQPQPGVLRLVPTSPTTNKDDIQKNKTAATGALVIDHSQTQLKSPDGASVAVQGKTVYQFGQRYYGSAEEMRPQQITGFTSARHPTEDMFPKSNVFMSILDLLPAVDGIMVLAKFCKNIYKLGKNWSATVDALWNSAKTQQDKPVQTEELVDQVNAKINEGK